MSKIRWWLLGVLAILLCAIGIHKACMVPRERVLENDWKFNDDYSHTFPHCDFIKFKGGSWILRNDDWLLRSDTVYRADTVVAVVLGAYHYAGADRLFLRVLSTGEVVEYIGK